jgi:hypothetical protein
VRFNPGMSETYTIVPAEIPLPGWLTVLRNGEPEWHAPKESAERYAREKTGVFIGRSCGILESRDSSPVAQNHQSDSNFPNRSKYF